MGCERELFRLWLSVHAVAFPEHLLLPGSVVATRDVAAKETTAALVSMELVFCGRRLPVGKHARGGERCAGKVRGQRDGDGCSLIFR